jgi:class 3 adenylate cyclase/pimeloyl-ACP methyl ester carboxylesterase
VGSIPTGPTKSLKIDDVLGVTRPKVEQMVSRSEPRYALSGDVHIAYQVVGDGPVDIIYTPGIWSNLDVMWEWPAWQHYLERLASFSRLVLFDMRGVGLSDRGSEPPLVELQMDDVGAVLDAVGSDNAVIFGGARGAAMTTLFAASHPDRTQALILYSPLIKGVRAPDWPYGRTEEEQQEFYEQFSREMGTGKNLSWQAPSGDVAFKRWWARFERLGASPGAWREVAEIMGKIDVRRVIDLIQAPTLVIHRTGDRVNDVAQGRAIANLIPGARFSELPGVDHLQFLGDSDAIVDEIEEFVTGTRPVRIHERVLATVLFTDVVGSTDLAVQLGDRRWRETLEEHRALVRTFINRYRGREINTTGDGFLATFDGPARAVRCALDITREVRSLDLEVRAGVHTGEVELMGDDIGGIAVHVGARVASAAQPSEVLVTRMVVDLVAGSGLDFDDRGEHELKGAPGLWRLFAANDREDRRQTPVS